MTILAVAIIAGVLGYGVFLLLQLRGETRDARRFAEAYAERSGMTTAYLALSGRVVVRCHCGDPMCEGWAMVPRDLVESTRRSGLRYLGGTDYSLIYWPDGDELG